MLYGLKLDCLGEQIIRIFSSVPHEGNTAGHFCISRWEHVGLDLFKYVDVADLDVYRSMLPSI